MALDWLPLLRHHTDRFAEVLDGADLAAPVAHCPGWSVRDLAVHLGGVHQWAAHAVTHQSPSLVPSEPGAAAGLDELVAWYRRSAAGLVEVLESAPADAPAWTLDPDDRAAGFWRRRQVHETAMHAWDLEGALGTPRPYDPALAWDGVLEVAGVMYPRQVRLGRVDAVTSALRLVPTDVAGEVTLGAGAPVEVRDTAEVLLRLIWHRADTSALDPRAASLLAGALAP
ncbi:maleylpyruvate isomerase family mycothiol-dependent enzyme [Nocardioides sp.]|uniref:maleylpyruvate isomerase family mycothiol-dependent enzyme n=1 Tax=Nocardioides sp. TaxID=35761 RepID=UPI0035B4E70E